MTDLLRRALRRLDGVTRIALGAAFGPLAGHYLAMAHRPQRG